MIETIKINTYDENRVILSDTIPSEVPIIFSNYGFHNHLQLKKGFIYEIITKSKKSYTIPFTYKISKGLDDFRPLSLIHPSNQYLIIKFYEKYSNIICYYTSLSEATLRAPDKIGEKSINRTTIKDESISSNLFHTQSSKASLYFKYRGFNRLYKFLESDSFLSYEKKFTNLHMIDITKFFPSIYTHSISWAIRHKEFIKDNVNEKIAFSAKFDELMQSLNYRETNGIIIGPEISRIFAEIIIQRIDIDVILKLEQYGYKFNKDYVFKRYVDDYFIFYNSDVVYKKLIRVIKDSLFSYNLHINKEKISHYSRPFFTNKSNLIHNLNSDLQKLYRNISTKNNNHIFPKKIYSYTKVKRSFIHSIKSNCMFYSDSLNIATNYLIGALTIKIEDFISTKPIYTTDIDKSVYNNYLILLTDLIFYLYSLNPSVNTSYKLCKIIIKIPVYYTKYLHEYLDSINQSILNFSLTILKQENFNRGKVLDNEAVIEKLNLLLVLSILGKDYLLDEKFIISLFGLDKNDLTYFDVICSLYYIKDYEEFNHARSLIENFLSNKFSKLDTFLIESETCHLALDMLSCPYIEKDFKISILKEIYTTNVGKTFTYEYLNTELEKHQENYWFVDWNEINLLNSIEQKEILQSY